MPWVKSNLVCIALAIALQTQTARAEGDPLGADEMAEAIVSMTSRVWTGPRTASPDRVPRPREASLALRSPHALLTVHADPSVDQPTLRRTMAALELARARLDAMGWPAPISDGGLGGGPEVDLYLTVALPPDAYSDGLAPWAYLDRASTFAVLSPVTPTAAPDACVTAAYVEALLMSMDPAEALADGRFRIISKPEDWVALTSVFPVLRASCQRAIEEAEREFDLLLPKYW